MTSIHPFVWQLLSGVVTTLELVVCAVILGGGLALILTVMSLAWPWCWRYLLAPYVFVIRGTPLLVQIFIIYYGLSQFASLRASILWPVLAKPFACAVLALAINTSAYTIVLLRGAIRSIPRGEIEACHALGMSWWLMMRRIILPRAVQIMLPAYSNEVVIVLKSTSLASTITMLDLMGVTQRIIAQTYASIEFLLLAGAIYFALNFLLMSLFRKLEERLGRFKRA